jgi:hypothetical protein
VAGAAALNAGVGMFVRVRSQQYRVQLARYGAPAVLAAAVLVAPLWAAIVDFSRRLKPQTQQVVAAWLRRHASGKTVLLEDGWLDLADSDVRTRRVRNLTETLDYPLRELSEYELVLVPETHFAHPRLKEMYLVHRVKSDQRSFGGNMGYDFDVYALPKQK